MPQSTKSYPVWLQINAIRRILRQHPRFGSRWVLTWKEPEENSTHRRAKARLVVLGYEDPPLTGVVRDAPTLKREGRSIVLQIIASKCWQLHSFDIHTAFLRGKADASNPLGMEPPLELRELVKLRADEVCELVGNAYGRVDAPLLFYRELSQQLFKLGFRHHSLDPGILIFESWESERRALHGVLGMHVDDGVGGGDNVYHDKLKMLQQKLPFGAEKHTSFIFTGMHLHQRSDFAIVVPQAEHVET